MPDAGASDDEIARAVAVGGSFFFAAASAMPALSQAG